MFGWLVGMHDIVEYNFYLLFCMILVLLKREIDMQPILLFLLFLQMTWSYFLTGSSFVQYFTYR